MNAGHKLHMKRNRLSRCKKRLTNKDLPTEQRTRIDQRAAELEAELNRAETK